MCMSKNRLIENATETEKAEIMALYRMQLGREFCPWNEYYPSETEIEYDLSRDALFVMKTAEGNIIGAVSIDLDPAVEELECWNPKLQPGGELSRLCVHPDYQGQRLAKELVSFGMEELKRRGYKSLHFLVNRHNEKALHAYADFKFPVVGEMNLYHQDMFCCEIEL